MPLVVELSVSLLGCTNAEFRDEGLSFERLPGCTERALAFSVGLSEEFC
jgi:hypothetical protein